MREIWWKWAVSGKVALAACAICLAAVPAAAQTTLAESTDTSTPGGNAWWGQSFIVTGTGSYGRITFTFLEGTTSVGNGRLYIFGSAYNGRPAGLSAAGALASATYNDGSGFVFAPSFRLNAGTTYYAYSDTNFFIGVGSGYSGGQIFLSNGSQSNFSSNGLSNFDAGFRVTSATPEPATWALMILGFGAIGGALRRRRDSARIRAA